MIESNIEDISLVTKIIQDKNKQAETMLYVKYKKIIENFINKTYYFNSNTEDDVSDILMKIFEKLTTYNQNQCQFNTWVITISKNHMIDKFRKNKNNISKYNCSFVSTSDCLNNNYDYDNNYSQTVFSYEPHSTFTANQQFETSDVLNYISSKISYDDFDMLKMKYQEGLDYNEISKKFNITSSTASNRVNYIKSKLKKIEIL